MSFKTNTPSANLFLGVFRTKQEKLLLSSGGFLFTGISKKLYLCCLKKII